MALDAYSPCPCGSGKKFKWCCQPIHAQIDQAFQQNEAGQHVTALKLMDEVVKTHPTNPEGWGRKAQLLYQNDRVDEAEAALRQALQINPQYPFGYFLQGVFRQNEMEFQGALQLFRKAAQLYHPDAHDYLSQIYGLIAQCEMGLNRPVAAHAAMRIALHHNPADEDLRRTLEQVFGSQSRLPLAARREYKFEPVQTIGSDASWSRSAADAATGNLQDVVTLFEKRVQADAADRTSWYNLAIALAWLGQNNQALEALDRYVTLDADEGKAIDAWALGEVLRLGDGLEDESDYVEHWVQYRVLQPEPLLRFLENLQANGRLIGTERFQTQGGLAGLILQPLPNLTPELARRQVRRLGATLLLVVDHIRLWHTDAAALAGIRAELEQAMGPGLAQAESGKSPAKFHEILSEALVFPIDAEDKPNSEQRVRQAIENFLEEVWIHRPLHSLNGVPPIDAIGNATLRRKVAGDILFLEQCAAAAAIPADFMGVRRKLGLVESTSAGPATREVGAMSAAELAALDTEGLSDDQLEAGFQAALKLDAREIAGRFARQLVGRPARGDRPDRYPWYTHMIQEAVGEGNYDLALDYVNQGEKADCEHNQGRRRNDFELRRAQVLAKRGDADAAERSFQGLIDRIPSDLRVRGSAAEAMLSMNQPARALRFAEQGLAQARQTNDRDSEEYFNELVTAARRGASPQ